MRSCYSYLLTSFLICHCVVLVSVHGSKSNVLITSLHSVVDAPRVTAACCHQLRGSTVDHILQKIWHVVWLWKVSCCLSRWVAKEAITTQYLPCVCKDKRQSSVCHGYYSPTNNNDYIKQAVYNTYTVTIIDYAYMTVQIGGFPYQMHHFSAEFHCGTQSHQYHLHWSCPANR